MYDTMIIVRTRMLTLARAERSTSAIECGLLVALIAVLIIGGVSLLGSHLEGMFVHTAAGSS